MNESEGNSYTVIGIGLCYISITGLNKILLIYDKGQR
jgi:hypothetical protein